jgi:HTH-type transcriptional regulator/antitoxin HipB
MDPVELGPDGVPGDNAAMAQGKRISAEIGGDALQAIQEMGRAARLARSAAGEGQAAAAARLGVHVQTIGRIEAGEPGVAIGNVLGLLALYGIGVRLQQPDGH